MTRSNLLKCNTASTLKKIKKQAILLLLLPYKYTFFVRLSFSHCSTRYLQKMLVRSKKCLFCTKDAACCTDYEVSGGPEVFGPPGEPDVSGWAKLLVVVQGR